MVSQQRTSGQPAAAAAALEPGRNPGETHLPLAARSASCPRCRQRDRPLWRVGRHRMCASCATRALAVTRPLGVIAFGSAPARPPAA